MSGGASRDRDPGANQRKRKASDDENSQEQGDGQGNKRPRTLFKLADNASQIFACPFFKRTPRKHRGCRSCIGPGWDSVHRVKY